MSMSPLTQHHNSISENGNIFQRTSDDSNKQPGLRTAGQGASAH